MTATAGVGPSTERGGTMRRKPRLGDLPLGAVVNLAVEVRSPTATVAAERGASADEVGLFVVVVAVVQGKVLGVSEERVGRAVLAGCAGGGLEQRRGAAVTSSSVGHLDVRRTDGHGGEHVAGARRKRRGRPRVGDALAEGAAEREEPERDGAQHQQQQAERREDRAYDRIRRLRDEDRRERHEHRDRREAHDGPHHARPRVGRRDARAAPVLGPQPRRRGRRIPSRVDDVVVFLACPPQVRLRRGGGRRRR
mmetsp:Transcript_3626/g.14154  ORF Transcript_3626/g.14154 Transcript_3626/m.14154 type:complete len:252 (-) Transcript_3626:186-941(-)